MELIDEQGGIALFAASRPDVWHFVTHDQLNTLSQFHLPRYHIARALALKESYINTACSEAFGIFLQGESVFFLMDDKLFPLPKKIITKMRRDISVYQKACAEIETVDNLFIVPGATTPNGYDVVTEHRSLAEAILFEKKTRKKLDPYKFALYSAYCTWREFCDDNPDGKRNIAKNLAN